MFSSTVPTVQIQQESPANVVRSQIAIVNEAKLKLKEKRDELENLYHNDPEYHKTAIELQSLQDRKRELKKILVDQIPSAPSLKAEIKTLGKQAKSCQLSLNFYLLEYEKKTGYDTLDGKKIVKNCRLATKK